MSQLKDYYTILELTPSATTDEIRKAYRRLAQIYHPDKNGDDQYALARFTEIKEAYETLTNPTRKAHYLQLRWYAKSIGKPLTVVAFTPVSFLQKLLELDKYVRTLDSHRMDEEGLSRYMKELFSDELVQKLLSFNDPSVIKEIGNVSLRTLHSLSYPFAKDIVVQVKKLAKDDSLTISRFDELLAHKKRIHYWEKRRTGLVLGAVLLLCLLIFFLTKK